MKAFITEALKLLGGVYFLMSSDKSFKKKEYATAVVHLLLGASLIFFFLFGDALASRNNWRLFLYSTPTPNTNYTVAAISGYNKRDCLKTGLSTKPAGGSFECGQSCEMKEDYYIEVCDVVCNATSCRD